MVSAFVFISAVPEQQAGLLHTISERPEVIEGYRLASGEWVVRLVCPELSGVHQFVADQLRNEGVEIRIERVDATLKAAPPTDKGAQPPPPPPRTGSSRFVERESSGTREALEEGALPADDAVYAADEDAPAALDAPAPPSVVPPSRSSGSHARPLTNRERDVIRALAAVVWVDGHADPSELQIVDQVIAGYAVNAEQRKELRDFVREERALDSDMALERLSAEDRELLLTNAAIITHADGVQLPSEKTILSRLGKLLGYSEEQATVIVKSAVEEGAISLSSRVLEEEPE
ncbi:TerB family tellurite resistance protein [Pendulispora albinea]|uniref:TerB family tellurite resistance protein n=1 Tax=Pendulispora albinea TaxID=2741071 RepID=A0ABZ2M9B2_9BACT